MNARTLVSGLFLLALSSAAVAAPACLPTVEKAWVRAAPPGATTLAGYAVLRNGCPAEVAIKGVAAKDFAMAMVHRTDVVGGVSRMRRAGTLAIAPGESLAMAPGGTHLMLMHPRRVLKPGQRTRVEIELADGRRVGAEFVVASEAPSR